MLPQVRWKIATFAPEYARGNAKVNFLKWSHRNRGKKKKTKKWSILSQAYSCILITTLRGRIRTTYQALLYNVKHADLTSQL